MKQKLVFLKMLWRVLRNKEQGWIWFKLNEQEQKNFLTNKEPTEITVRFIGVDKRVIEKIIETMGL